MQQFEGIEHCTGGDIPVPGAFFAAAVIGVAVDELVEAQEDFLYAFGAASLIAVDEEDGSEPIPTNPGIPVVDGLNFAIGDLDPREVVTGFSAGEAHPHEVLLEERIEDVALAFDVNSLADEGRN